MNYANNILETIGQTPLVKLNKLTAELPCLVLAKYETFNPGNSVKDRMALQMIEDAEAAYVKREGELGPEVMRELERKVLLSVLDRKWREHLYEMDYLQEGIGLRAMAQRDPLVEYQREGYELFSAMMDGIKEELASLVFNVQVSVEGDGSEVKAAGISEKPTNVAPLQYTAADESGISNKGDVSRNSPCPCGSGKKYKRCHGGA